MNIYKIQRKDNDHIDVRLKSDLNVFELKFARKSTYLTDLVSVDVLIETMFESKSHSCSDIKIVASLWDIWKEELKMSIDGCHRSAATSEKFIFKYYNIY